MSVSWEEIKQAKEKKKRELIISGTSYSQRIEKHGLDLNIFQVYTLNFLEISKTCLKDLPVEIGDLSGLTNVVISHNKLQSLPPDVGKLKKLKFLDVSFNEISELPDEMGQMTDLQSFNVSSNKISSIPDFSKCLNLVLLNISNNSFSNFPVSVCNKELIHFTDLIANNNSITNIPPEIENLQTLRNLDIRDNAITVIPGELGGCPRIKELLLNGNKFQDKRLLKMVEKCHFKQVIDYIRSNCTRSSDDNNKQDKSKKRMKRNKKFSESEEVNQLLDELKILHVTNDTIKIIYSAKVADVRPFIVACILRDVNLMEENSLKKFITLQTKLHDSICEKRTVATIATHDVSKMEGNLIYDAKSPDAIKLIPLRRKKEVTASELYAQLNEEADAFRKEKKKNSYSGIHKYLYLLKDKTVYPCLMDSTKRVISFPPITNSEETKISEETKNILLEVTGNNLNSCKKVMDTLLVETLKLGIGHNSVAMNKSDDDSEPTQHFLTVEQMQIVDEEGKLKVVYPSRTDLEVEGIVVNRT